MLSLLWLWCTVGLMWGVGFLWVRRILRETNPFLAIGLPLPVTMLVLLGLSNLLSPWASHRNAWIAALLLLAGSGAVMLVRAAPPPSMEWPPLRRIHCLLLAGGLAGAYFAMHTRGLSGPEDDYWIHFPVIAMIGRGWFPPLNPFFPELTLHGHFGRDYLLAVLARVSRGDIMLATWVFNHTLQVSAFSLACGMGLRWGKTAAAGVLLPLFLFFGISTGSRVGLMDTYDNNNLLVYVCLLALLALIGDALEHRDLHRYLGVGALLGVYAGVYETHFVLAAGCLFLSPLALAWCRKARPEPGALRAVALALLLAAGVALLQVGPIRDLALRSAGIEQVDQVDYDDAYQAQRVSLKFPKAQLFQIKLGRDAYRRLSYVYEGKLFSELLKATDQGGYTYIWSPRVLMMHWLAVYLGIPAILVLARQRNLMGLLFWLFGCAGYLVPALVDFGPVHENEYFRWEFAAAFGFAGALALALAGLWTGSGRGGRTGLLLVGLLTLWGGERKLNRELIAVQKAPPEQRALLLNPLYPDSQRWFLAQKALRMTLADLLLCEWLRERLGPQDTMLTNLDGREHWDVFRESTIVGIAGARSVGHQSPPPWMPDGIAPFFRTPNWTVFWQHLDDRALPATGASWLYVQGDRALVERLESVGRLEKSFEVEGNLRAAFRVPPRTSPPAPAGLRVTRVVLPDSEWLQSEVAYPLAVVLQNDSRARVSWEGLLGLELLPLRPIPTGEPEPLSLWVRLDLAPGESQAVPFWLVPPLVEEEYSLGWFLESPQRPLPSPATTLSYSFLEKAGRLEIVRDELLRREGLTVHGVLQVAGEFRVRGPLTLGWRIWDLEEKRHHTPYGFDGSLPLELEIEAGDVKDIPYVATLPEPAERYRLDFFLRSRSGLESKLERR
ncbi:MAG: hypothetical protein HY319_28085 [Armatimonadetes bacterium]|nr:hypothetical protein [Armatimonadota bacterium]